MANKKQLTKDQIYKDRARALKAAKLIDVDLRHNTFSKSEKAKITRLWNDSEKRSAATFFLKKKNNKKVYDELAHAELSGDKKEITRLKKKFNKSKFDPSFWQIRTIKDNKKLKDFKDNGYLVVGNKVYIRTRSASDHAHIKKTVSPLTGNLVTIVEFKVRGKTVHAFVEPKINLYKELEKMKEKSPPFGAKVMVSVGGNTPIYSSQSADYASLMKYIQNWQPKDNNTSKEELIGHMAIVYSDIF